MKRARFVWPLAAAVLAVGCGPTAVAPAHPTWADVAPVLRGECAGCHGWTAKDTGGAYRFDLFEATPEVCGDAALALESGVLLAGSPASPPLIARDVALVPGASFARMPPLPAPALPDWERETLERWAAAPVKGPPPATNRPPTIAVSGFPAAANAWLAFTAILDDPDDDGAIGVVEVGRFAFLMNRTGAFGVTFDASAWPEGPARVSAVVCDGWAKSTVELGTVNIRH
jgi:hypothetical protein